MKKLSLMLVVLLLASLSLVAPLSANEPVNELTTLAEYAPDGSIFFATIRTDEAYIDTLNGLLNAQIEKIEAGTGESIPPLDLRDGLTEALGLAFEQSFAEDVRPWLGEHVAIFLPTFDTVVSGSVNNPLVIVAQVTDKNAAADFFASLYEFDIDFGDIERVDNEDGSILFNPTVSWLSPVLITDDLLFFGDIESAVMPGEDARKLSSNADFTATLDALPEDAYNGILYLNPSPVVQIIDAFGPMMLGESWPDLDVAALSEMLGQQALGVTVLNNRTLVLDVATTGAMGDNGALDSGLLSLAPADTALLVQGHGLGGTISQLLDLLYVANDLLTEAGALPLPDAGPLDFLGPDDIAKFLTLTVEGTYGVDLEETLAWMDGDHLLLLRAAVGESLAESGIEAAFLQSTDNPEATRDLVDGIAYTITRQFNPATYEDGVLSVPLGSIISMPELGALTLTANDDFMLAGSSGLVEFMLAGGDSLTDTAGFEYESGLFVNEPDLLMYINGLSIREAAASLVETMGMAESEEGMVINTLLNLVDSSAISLSQSETGVVARFTISFSE